jgi:hypothetical protein
MIFTTQSQWLQVHLDSRDAASRAHWKWVASPPRYTWKEDSVWTSCTTRRGSTYGWICSRSQRQGNPVCRLITSRQPDETRKQEGPRAQYGTLSLFHNILHEVTTTAICARHVPPIRFYHEFFILYIRQKGVCNHSWPSRS